VLLPEDLYIPINEFTENPKVVALAFTIKAENLTNANGSRNVITTMQDIEYKKAGVTKLFQSQLGSCFYAHGAIAMWEKSVLVRVLEEHNTLFDGEDLQMGVIMHQFNQNYQMKAVGNVPTPTTVPNHTICCSVNYTKNKNFFYRLFTAPYNCNHAEKSLFQQRVKSWDKAAHRVWPHYLKILFFYWRRSVLGLKIFMIYELWSIIQDWIRVPVLAILIYESNNWQPFLITVGVLTLFQIVSLCYMNYWSFRSRPDLQTPFIFCVLYPGYNFLLIVLRAFGLIYNLLFYLPFVRTPPKIKERFNKPGIFDGKFITINGEELSIPTPAEIANPATVLRGARRIRKTWEVSHYNISKNVWEREIIVDDNGKVDFFGNKNKKLPFLATRKQSLNLSPASSDSPSNKETVDIEQPPVVFLLDVPKPVERLVKKR